MKKNSVFKKIVLINLILLFSTKITCCVNYDYLNDYEYDYNLISQYNLPQNVQNACLKYIKKSGYNPKSNNFPNKLIAEYNLKVDQTLQELQNSLQSNWQTNIYYYEIRQSAEKHLSSLKRTLSTITLSNSLTSRVEQLIKKLINTSTISQAESLRRKQIVITDLRQIMTKDYRNYLRQDEIEKQIKKTFLNPPKASSWSQPSSYNANTTYNAKKPSYNYNTNYNNSSSYTSNQIKRHQLDSNILEIATNLLGIHPEKIPARAISDYSSKIQKIKTRLNNSMSYNKDYVTIADIKRVCKEELQSIIDKISYKNERCAICQDKYKPKDKVGTLSCNGGHIFHKDCIYQWLKADNKKSCPLCRQQNVIVAKIEDVPYRKTL